MNIKYFDKLSILFVLICFISCDDFEANDPMLDHQIQLLNKSSDYTINSSQPKIVYVTGYIGYYDDGASGALAWRNGLCSMLIDNCGSKTSCIAFDENILYLVGVNQYFKNGVRIPLGTNSTSSNTTWKTSDIVISNHDVYISGTCNSAVYWKNGMINALSGGTDATGIFVTSSNDVYVSGKCTIWKSWKDITTYARYWKNGHMYDLGIGDAVDIAVKDTDVYVLGSQNNKAVLWKNGVKTILSEAADCYATHLKISGDDIIITGWIYSNAKASSIYWRNGIMNQLNSNGYSSQTTSIFVDPDNNDLYISGNIGDGSFQNAVYWKNDILTILPANIAFAYGGKMYSSTDIVVK